MAHSAPRGLAAPGTGIWAGAAFPHFVPACLKWSRAGLHVDSHSEACPWKHRDPRAEARGC